MRPVADLMILNADELLTLSGNSSRPKTGRQLDDLGIIKNGALAIAKDRIIACGTVDEVESSMSLSPDSIIIDASGKVAMPGFIDCHTHLVFAGSREDEFELRIKGTPYLDILKSGGGIQSTVRATRAASKAELVKKSLGHLDTMLKFGTTTIEAKSGYGLTLESELKQLQVMGELNSLHPVEIIPTFLVHVTPPEFETSDKYIEYVINDMLPGILGMAEYCDIFCEQDIFEPAQCEKVLAAAKMTGFKLKLHADQLTPMGGAQLAADIGAVSASHLDHISQSGIAAMADTGTIGVLTPGASFFLGSEAYPPAPDMISGGMALALATDFNPGSCPSESMQIVLTLACIKMKMTPAQVISATTINAAHAINRGDAVGSLEAGKQADVIILDVPNHKMIPYHFGVNLVSRVVKKGKIVI